MFLFFARGGGMNRFVNTREQEEYACDCDNGYDLGFVRNHDMYLTNTPKQSRFSRKIGTEGHFIPGCAFCPVISTY
jgi:hypothetical protein